MANKPKSRVNTKNSSQLTQFKFSWWMALVLVGVIAVIGVIIIRFSNASTADGPAPTGPIYWIGDSLSTGFLVSGNLPAKLEAAGYSPAYINANPGRSITQNGFSPGVNALSAVDADNKNVCPEATAVSVKKYCSEHNNNYNPIKDAKTIMLYIGTNPETDQTKSFSQLQQDLLTKLRAINPNARYIWADIAAPGNYALATGIDNLNFARLGNPRTTLQDMINIFNETRLRLFRNQVAIYANSIKLNYSVFSQYKFFWQDKYPSITQFPQITDQKDAQSFIVDGTHYSPAGSDKLTTYIVESLKTGNFVKIPLNIIPIDLTDWYKIDLINPPDPVRISQGNNTGCVQQNGFKSNSTYKGCRVDNTTPLKITPNTNNFPNAQTFFFTNKIVTVCATSITADPKPPLTVTFSYKGRVVSTATAVYGSGSELAKILACGDTNAPVGLVDTITVSSPQLALVNVISFKQK